MFLVNFLSQHRKFAGPSLLPVYRVCMKIMVIDCFWSPCTQFYRYHFLLNTTRERSSKRFS